MTSTPEPPASAAESYALALVAYRWFNFGPFGVGVFFLISGLVIPLSLAKIGPLGFAGARLLRIYPTYIAALMLELGVMAASSVAWHRPMTFSVQVVVANALLIYDVMGLPSLDLVNWTLSVELKFYLVALLLIASFRRGQVWVLLAAGSALVGINAAMARGWIGDIGAPPSTVDYTASSQSVCLVFMLIGVAFNFHLRGLASTRVLILVVGTLTAMFVLSWRLSVWSAQYPVVTVNYLYALALFASLYAVRGWVPDNRALDALAAISFPFYIVHSLLGYTLLRTLMVGLGFGYPTALLCTLPLLLLVATMLHRTVELPTTRAGHALARYLNEFGVRRTSNRDAELL